MIANKKINRLEPWDQGLAVSMLEEHDIWLDNAAKTCIESSPTRGDAVERLAGLMECYLTGAIEELWDSTPKHVIMSMAGFWEMEPDLDLCKVSDAVLEEYWPEGTAKPARYSGKTARSNGGKPKQSANRKPRTTTGKAPARKPANRRR